MADIELVIKISEEVYEHMLKVKSVPDMLGIDIVNTINAVKTGKQLPKGHGDLIDISKLPVTTTYFGISDKPTKVVNYNCILNARKIIKTDKA